MALLRNASQFKRPRFSATGGWNDRMWTPTRGLCAFCRALTAEHKRKALRVFQGFQLDINV